MPCAANPVLVGHAESVAGWGFRAGCAGWRQLYRHDAGKGDPQEHFTALDTQPKYRLNNGELMIHLHAPDLGALNSGSLVYFRKIPVGRVYDYAINANKQGVTIDVLIERRFTNPGQERQPFLECVRRESGRGP